MADATSERKDGTQSLRGMTCEGCKYYKVRTNDCIVAQRKCTLYKTSAIERCYDYRPIRKFGEED